MAVGRESCGRHAVAFGGAEEKESDALVLEGDGPNNQHNFVNRARKKLIINSLSAMDGLDCPLLNSLCSTVVSCRIFIPIHRV